MNIVLIYFTIKYDGDWDKIFKGLEDKEKIDFNELDQLEKKVKEKDWEFVSIIDKNYPQKLKNAYKPPFILWYKGDLNKLSKKSLCVTGGNVNEHVLENIKNFFKEKENTHEVVNMNYKGVDKEVIKNLSNGYINVLASGLDKVVIKKENLYITEYPYGSLFHRDKCRNRNRITASIADSLVLFSSEKDDPINHLVTNFLTQGKEVYCYPGDGTKKDGNSLLIKDGASYITNYKDINNVNL